MSSYSPLTLSTINVPSPLDVPPGCRLHPRCPLAQDICRSAEPPLTPLADGHASARHFAEEARAGWAGEKVVK